MLTSIGIFVAKSIASFSINKGFNNILTAKNAAENRLAKVIDHTIEEYKKNDPIEDNQGKFAFYKSQILVDELLKCRFFSKGKYQPDVNTIQTELKKNPNIIPPDQNQINIFLTLFEQNIKADEELKSLVIDENYKEEIFNISATFDAALTAIKAIKQDTSEIKEDVKKLIDKTPSGTFPKELTSLSRVSKKNIVGRKKELQALRDSLLQNKETALINGMGGIGKTTLAAVYADTFYADYDHIVWLTIENTVEEAILANYSLLKNLKIQDIQPNQQLRACLNELRILESKRPKLLIIDNANESLSANYQELPKAPAWHVLVTSRERITPFHIIDLDFLLEGEAILLFKKFCKRYSDEQMGVIVNRVELHTLTIEILAKSAQKNHWSFEKVQEAFAIDAIAGIDIDHSNYEKIERIKSYLTGIFKISNLGKHENYLLKQFTALPNLWLDYEFLKEILQVEELEWQEEFSGVLENLYLKGYIQKEDKTDSYKMHPVLVESLFSQIKTTPGDLEFLIDRATNLLSLDQAKENPLDKFQYIPFGDAILKLFPRKDCSEISTLQNNLGLRYSDLGEYEKARDLLETALKSALENFGAKHPNVAVSQSNLANVYRNLGEYEKARDLWLSAYTIFLKTLGENHPNTKTVKEFLDNIK